MLRDAAPDLADREVFTCGPAPYMAAVRGLLAQAGAAPERCHEESFVLGPRVGPRWRATAGATYTVELRRSGRSFPATEHTPLLTAAAAGRHHAAVLVPGGRVRHLQDHAARRPRRHEPPGRHPPARDRAGQDPALLLDAPARTSSSTPDVSFSKPMS